MKKKENGKKSFTDFLLTFFLIGLIFCSYLAIGEEYVTVCTLIALFSLFKCNKIIVRHSVLWIIFIIYYLGVTIVGLIIGVVDFKDFLEMIIQYPCIIIILTAITRKTSNMECSLGVFKSFIFFSAVYGFIESVVKYNFLPNYFSAPVMDRIVAMNALSHKYQASSFFLHYSLFGIFLLIGIVINMVYPFRKKSSNLIYYSLCIVDLYFCKSRMCWLALVLILLYNIISKRNNVLKVKRKSILIAIGLFSFGVMFWQRFTPVLLSIYYKFSVVFKYGFEYGSFGQRFGTLLRIPMYMCDYPLRGLFGTGYDSIQKAFLESYSYFENYSVADNQLTTFLVEIGLLGTGIVVVGIVLFFKHNRIERSISKYVLIIILFSSITIDVVGTIYLTAMVIWPFIIFNEFERINNVYYPRCNSKKKHY